MGLQSIVKGHEGDCKLTWSNRNTVDQVTAGGITGFFVNTKKVFFGLFTVSVGEEFHGIVKWGSQVVETTRGK